MTFIWPSFGNLFSNTVCIYWKTEENKQDICDSKNETLIIMAQIWQIIYKAKLTIDYQGHFYIPWSLVNVT